MKLNYNSWHARWYIFLSKKDPPGNLCDYAWGFFLRSALALTVAAFIFFSIVMVGLAIYDSWPQSLYYILLVLGILAGVIAVPVCIVWFFFSSTTAIVREYVKARKESYCPRIEWEE